MHIHEYQSKSILHEFDITVPDGYVAYTAEEAVEAAKNLNTEIIVIKAQIHAGGRGDAGGIKLADKLTDVHTFANEMLGSYLVTPQTGDNGKKVTRLLIEKGISIQQEYYAGLVLDRKTSRIVMMASKEGGTEIENVSNESPEKIFTEVIDPLVGLSGYQARCLAFNLDISDHLIGEAVNFMQKIYDVFIEKDCTLAEINPLVVTDKDEIIALDAKLNFDDNAAFRQREIMNLRDLNEEDAKELRADNAGLSYVALDGNIGCMVNGAGLAMSTMDIIQHHGGNPANFLDVGGGAKTDKVIEAFRIIMSDANVEGILVNIFGGIMQCDVIAEGIVEATRETGLDMPLIVRLEGTNVQTGKRILEDSGLNITIALSMADSAEKIVTLVN